MIASQFLNHQTMFTAGLALCFAFSNGFRDSSTIVATVVSTRVLSPIAAFSLCAVFEFIGAMVLGSAVASTIGHGILGGALVKSREEILLVLGAALLAAVSWGIVSWWRGWPTSNNHALFAGLSGASLAMWGASHFQNRMVGAVLIVLVVTPLLGFLVSAGFTAFLRFIGGWMTPRVKPVAEALHVLSCVLVSSAHGSNDGQMSMGVLMAALGFSQVLARDASIPASVRAAVASAISLGVLFGGRNILKKLGMKFYRIHPPQGLGAELTAAGTILSCVFVGFPASTTQVIAGSIVGAGVAKNPRAVRWAIAQEIVLSWFLTLPTVGIFAYLICEGLRWSMGGAG